MVVRLAVEGQLPGYIWMDQVNGTCWVAGVSSFLNFAQDVILPPYVRSLSTVRTAARTPDHPFFFSRFGDAVQTYFCDQKTVRSGLCGSRVETKFTLYRKISIALPVNHDDVQLLISVQLQEFASFIPIITLFYFARPSQQA